MLRPGMPQPDTPALLRTALSARRFTVIRVGVVEGMRQAEAAKLLVST